MADTPTPGLPEPEKAIRAIREALTLGPTWGRWLVDFYTDTGGFDIYTDFPHATICRRGQWEHRKQESEANARLIGACNPEAMTAVLSLLASKDAEIERLRADAGSVERNRDMWKGQCERQAEALTSLRGQMRVLTALLSECLGPLEVSAAIFESDDAEPLEELITKVQKALAALSAKAIGGEQ